MLRARGVRIALSALVACLLTAVPSASGEGIAWSEPLHLHYAADLEPDALSCTTGFCGAVIGGQDVLFSRHPSKAWHRVRLRGALRVNDVSCPSPHLCVAVEDTGSGELTIYTSTRPASARSWRRVVLKNPGGETAQVECPAPTMCVITASANLVSAHPAAGARAWKRKNHHASGNLGVTCPSPRLCLATDIDGSARRSSGLVQVLSDPLRPGSRWRTVRVARSANGHGPPFLFGSTCVAPSACLLLFLNEDGSSGAMTSIDPLAGPDAWAQAPLPAAPPRPPSARAGTLTASCVSLHFCAVGDEGLGDIVFSTNPFDPVEASWQRVALPLSASSTADLMDCYRPATCVVVASDPDQRGYYITTSRPS